MLLAGGCRPADQSEPDAGGSAADTAAVVSEIIATKLGIEMVRLPGGEFVMGDREGQEDEQPPHRVQVSPFYIDVSEVTQASYQKLMGANPSKFQGPDRPVERVSWYSATQYCNMRSLREGLTPCYRPETLECDFAANGYRLPTEAEWEYAARAGTTTRWPFGSDPRQLDKHGWFRDNAEKTTHSVKTKTPSPWGLYDMQGNVAEWCNDCMSEGYDAADARDPHGASSGEDRVLRGGNWQSDADACRSAARNGATPRFADACFGTETYGFRCVRRAEP